MKTATLNLKLINGKFTLSEKEDTKFDFLTIILLLITVLSIISATYLIYILSK